MKSDALLMAMVVVLGVNSGCGGGDGATSPATPTFTPTPTPTPTLPAVESLDILSFEPPAGTELRLNQSVRYTIQVATRRARPSVLAFLSSNDDGSGIAGCEDSRGTNPALARGVSVGTTDTRICSNGRHTIRSVRFELHSSPCDGSDPEDRLCTKRTFVFPASFTYAP